MNRKTYIACVAVLTLAALVGVEAQRRGGAPPGGARGGGPAVPRVGTIERITVHGKALEGNLEGDSPDRDVTVYLPPSYGSDPARRFPVVYLLHGYGGRENTFTESLARLLESGDKLAAAQGFSEVIVVTPNAFTLHKGSMYTASVTTGDWERFVAEDLVAYIDGHYRTLAARMSRGLAGHSMGGYGALRIGMQRPDVFSSLYAMSPCCVAPGEIRARGSFEASAGTTAAEAIRTREQAEAEARAPGYGASTLLGWAAAWSPNAMNPPLFLDLPVRNGVARPDIVSRWDANTTLGMLDQHAANLQRYYAFAIDIGTKDDLLRWNRQLHDALARLRVPHFYEEYDGDHIDHIRERVEKNLLPFFSKNLVAPANPTSPQIKG